MNTTCLRAAIVLLTVCLFGCSAADEGQVSELPSVAAISAPVSPAARVAVDSAKALAASSNAGTNPTTNRASNKVEEFSNPFAPPKNPPPPPMVQQPDPEPEPATPEPRSEIRQPGVPPKIRLLGFMNVGAPKVLISYRDELETLAIGESLEDMKVVKIESPELTMLFEENEIKFRLFDQSWRHDGSDSSVNGKGGQARPRATRPTRKLSSPSSAAATAGQPSREPSGIPGFAPNAGKPPGFNPSAPPATGSAPAARTGSPPPGLPGLSGEPNSGAGIGGGSIPGLSIDAGSKPATSIFPKLPGGP